MWNTTPISLVMSLEFASRSLWTPVPYLLCNIISRPCSSCFPVDPPLHSIPWTSPHSWVGMLQVQSALVASALTEPTTSTSDGKPFCAFCKLKYAIYTCPRCAFKSCSLVCSNGHKEVWNCSQVRDKTAYVPMNQYGLGTLANDYVYLEEVGRKVIERGRDIGQNGYMDASTGSNPRGHARGRGRGGRGRGGISRQAGRNHRREILRDRLEEEDIEMLLLPEGMERRKLNQSAWDPK
jgi:HIT zinc finger